MNRPTTTLALLALLVAASCGGEGAGGSASGATAGAGGAGGAGAAGKAGKAGAAGKAGKGGTGGGGAGGTVGAAGAPGGQAGSAGAAGSKPVPALAGWTQKPGSTECPVFLPNPGTMDTLPTLQWTPCESGLSGCRQLDRKTFKGGIRGAAVSKVGDDLYVTAKFLPEPWTDTSMFYTAVYGPDGKPVVAWGGVGGICVQPLAASKGRSFLRSVESEIFSVYEGTPQDILTAQTTDTPVFAAPAKQLSGMSYNQLGDGIGVWGALGTVVFDFATKQFSYPQLDVPAYHQFEPNVAGRDVWFNAQTLVPGDTAAKYLWKDGVVTKVVQRAPKHVWGFGTDGAWLVWWESTGSPLGSNAGVGTWHFVAAPYTTDPTKLAPVLDVDLTSLLPTGKDPGLSSNIVTGGGYAIASHTDFFRAYELKTGNYRDLPRYPVKNEMTWRGRGIYIDSKEVFMSLYDDQTLVRQDLAAVPLVTP